MTTTALKQLLDSCFTAKRVIETLPELPPGMKPRHIHVLEAVHALQEQNGACRVSDVSARLNVTLPSVTGKDQPVPRPSAQAPSAERGGKSKGGRKPAPDSGAYVGTLL